MSTPPTCDLFCTVVDNYGDIGIAWRLARQLAVEHRVTMRLWVNDLTVFQRLRPALNPTLAVQTLDTIEVRRWDQNLPDVVPGAIVIALLGCRIPEEWLARMAALHPQPVWLNLEHLSAETWIEGVHRLPSPHPRLPLTQHFFMPGFTANTGGLLREGDLLLRRDRFQNGAAQRRDFWRRINLPPEQPDELRVSLFGYENRALPELLDTWAGGELPIRVLLPEGRLLPQVAAWFGDAGLHSGGMGRRGALSLHVLPILDPDDYDRLLWGCDLNFVRGEDSFVRGQWAARPMIWQPYRQKEEAHTAKLEAFLGRYLEGLNPEAFAAAAGLWRCWNSETGIASAWPEFMVQWPILRGGARRWSAHLGKAPDLAENLMLFCRPWLKSAPI